MKGFSTDDIVRMALDVTSDADVKRVVKHIVDTEGKIDIVVNNAGITSRGVSSELLQPVPLCLTYIYFFLPQAL
jgi:1-acylglycerone phosphate reductase